MKKSRRGLALAEVVLAVGILAVAVLSLVLVFTKGMTFLLQSNQVAGATDVGREFLEVVRSNGYAFVSPGTYDGRIPTAQNGGTGFPPAPYPVGARSDQNYTLVVQADTAGMPPNTIAVKVDVYWNARGKVSLQTYLRP